MRRAIRAGRRMALMAPGLIAMLAALTAPAVHAVGETAAGLWVTIDDSTGKARSHVRIYENDGVFFGRIEKILIPGKSDKCGLCTDERKDQPALGLVIIRHMKPSTDHPDVWTGGDVLDPEKGAVYSSRMTLSSDGQTLQVRGFIGISLFARSQTWRRIGQ